MSSESLLYQLIHLMSCLHNDIALHLDLDCPCILILIDLLMQHIFSQLEPLDTVNRDFVSVDRFNLDYSLRFLALGHLHGELPLAALFNYCVLLRFFLSYSRFFLDFDVRFELVVHPVRGEVLSSLIVKV